MRSRVVLLGLMGAGAGALMIAPLLSRHHAVDAGVFPDLDSCTASGRYSITTCEQAFAEAQHHDLEHAPRYANRADCEADFAPGSCHTITPPNDPGAFFAPVMAGVLIGAVAGAATAAGTPPTIQPVYRSCTADPQDRCQPGAAGGGGWRGGFYTCSGYRVGSSYGMTRVEPAAFSPVRTSTLSRGGFGARARAASAAS
jgi:uncharacterized protein YgiB involved in biofilm formation